MLPSARLQRKRPLPRTTGPLWQTSLGVVISNLSQEHTDDFVQLVLGDSKLRQRFTDELLRRASHVADLGNTDLVEFVVLPVLETDDGDGHTSEFEIKYCKIAALPYWFNAALKALFRDRASSDPMTPSLPGEGYFTKDGRLEVHFYEDNQETHQPLIDAYIGHLDYTSRADCVPTREELGFFDASDEIDLSEVAPEVPEEGVQFDAYQMSLNDGEDRIREEIDEKLTELYMMHLVCDDDESSWLNDRRFKNAQQTDGSAASSTVWIRKPRVRIVVHSTCSD